MRSLVRPWLVLSGLAACGCSASEFDIPPWLRAPGRPVFFAEMEPSYESLPSVSYESSSATWTDPYSSPTSEPALHSESDPYGAGPSSPSYSPSSDIYGAPSPYSSPPPYGGLTSDPGLSPYSDPSIPTYDSSLTPPSSETTIPGLNSSSSPYNPYGPSESTTIESPPTFDGSSPGGGILGGPTDSPYENPYDVLRRNSGAPIDPSSFDSSSPSPPSGTESNPLYEDDRARLQRKIQDILRGVNGSLDDSSSQGTDPSSVPGVPSTDAFHLPASGPTNDFDTSRPFETQQERFSRLLREAMQGSGGTTSEAATSSSDSFGGLNSAPATSPFDRPGLFATSPDASDTSSTPTGGTSNLGVGVSTDDSLGGPGWFEGQEERHRQFLRDFENAAGPGTTDVPVHGGDRSILPDSLPVRPPEAFASPPTNENSSAPETPQSAPAASPPPAASESKPKASTPSVKDAGAKKG